MFAELLARSCFSFLRGASQPEELIERAKELDLGALALCDRGGLYGVVRAWVRARELGQRFIIGAELAVSHTASRAARRGSWDGRATRPRGQRTHQVRGPAQRKPNVRAGDRRAQACRGTEADDVPVVSLLVQDRTGYTNLCRLLTLAHSELPKGESMLEPIWLAEHASGLVALVPLDDACCAQNAAVTDLLGVLRESFADRAFLGVYHHMDGADQRRTLRALELSHEFGLSVVASARPLMHHRSRKSLLDVLWCIRKNMTLDEAGTRLLGNAEARLRSESQILRLFRDHKEWVERTGEIASALRFDLDELDYRFPCELEPGDSANAKLRRLTLEGLVRRYPHGIPEPVAVQVEKELRLIAELDMAAYFLSTWEIVEIARRRRILCQGRGSAANSAVCYALGITAVDPSRSNLLFERFMSAQRREPPDIDIDFEHERREEVIQEIYARYGRRRAAMVSEVIAYRGKSAVRDVAKAFGLSLEQVNRLSASVTHRASAAISDAELSAVGLDPRDARLRKVMKLSAELEGLPRHLSVHVGGFILSATDLCEVAPVEPARMQGRTVVPWDKDDLDALGFFKVDVLGLGMLTALRKCLALVSEQGEKPARPFDPIEALACVPPEDPVVYAMISRADTLGVFQIESRAQMAMLPRLRPRCFYDLVIEVAIVRPGPIQGGMVHPYLRRRNGEEAVTMPHPDLAPILERTLGVPLFQEQVMQLAIVGAGYSGGEADQLRRDMAAWRKTGRLLRHRERLLRGFARKGMAPEFGEALFEQIKGFGEYGFPESHAASFALLVYASAWLKSHAPAHFACALLNSQPLGFYSPSSIVRDAQRHGVRVRDVCVQQSAWDSTLEPVNPSVNEMPPASAGASSELALRLGLRLVKGLGEVPSERIEAACRESKPGGLTDLVRRTELRREATEALAEAGALEAMLPGRRQALWKARAPRLFGLFEGLELDEPEVRLARLSARERLMLDYDRKGLSIDDHPMNHLRSALDRRGVLRARELDHVHGGSWVTVAGMVLCRQQPMTASGVTFISLEDETGTANLIVQSRVFMRFSLQARHAQILLARGPVERQKHAQAEVAVVHVLARSLERLELPVTGLRHHSRDFR
jgi:error-prone DNA polymerase